MQPNRYPPVPPRTIPLEGGERHRFSFRLRGYRYGVARPEPLQSAWVAHLTDRRFLLEPLASAADDEDPIALRWNDIIEFEAIGGTRAAEELPGAEEHMILMTPRGDSPFGTDLFLFIAEPPEGAQARERPTHCQAFLEIADDLLLEAFEATEE